MTSARKIKLWRIVLLADDVVAAFDPSSTVIGAAAVRCRDLYVIDRERIRPDARLIRHRAGAVARIRNMTDAAMCWLWDLQERVRPAHSFTEADPRHPRIHVVVEGFRGKQWAPKERRSALPTCAIAMGTLWGRVIERCDMWGCPPQLIDVAWTGRDGKAGHALELEAEVGKQAAAKDVGHDVADAEALAKWWIRAQKAPHS